MAVMEIEPLEKYFNGLSASQMMQDDAELKEENCEGRDGIKNTTAVGCASISSASSGPCTSCGPALLDSHSSLYSIRTASNKRGLMAMQEQLTQNVVVEDIEPEVMRELLRYIYTGE